MMLSIDLSIVNPNCLQNVAELSKTHDVRVNDDIIDIHGRKILAQGARVCGSIYERLLSHKLAKPLETSLTISDGVSVGAVVDEAKRLLDETDILSGCLAAGNASSVVAVLESLSFDRVTMLLLTMVENRGSAMLRHGVLTAVVATALGMALRLPQDSLRLLALGGLVHDIGELYINPDFLKPHRELGLEEWKHIAVHPRVGEVVITELTQHSRELAQAVAEHHERFSGYGYPKGRQGHQISKLGAVLSMAETIGGMLMREDRPMGRVCLAVKMIPGDYHPELVSLVLRLGAAAQWNDSGGQEGADSVADFVGLTDRLHASLNAGLDEVTNALAANNPYDDNLAMILDYAKTRLLMLKGTLDAAGMSAKGFHDAVSCRDTDILLESEVILMETRWRLRELARQVFLKGTTGLKESALAKLMSLLPILTAK